MYKKFGGAKSNLLLLLCNIVVVGPWCLIVVVVHPNELVYLLVVNDV